MGNGPGRRKLRVCGRIIEVEGMLVDNSGCLRVTKRWRTVLSQGICIVLVAKCCRVEYSSGERDAPGESTDGQVNVWCSCAKHRHTAD